MSTPFVWFHLIWSSNRFPVSPEQNAVEIAFAEVRPAVTGAVPKAVHVDAVPGNTGNHFLRMTAFFMGIGTFLTDGAVAHPQHKDGFNLIQQFFFHHGRHIVEGMGNIVEKLRLELTADGFGNHLKDQAVVVAFDFLRHFISGAHPGGTGPIPAVKAAVVGFTAVPKDIAVLKGELFRVKAGRFGKAETLGEGNIIGVHFGIPH